jgi:hypothetical protein
VWYRYRGYNSGRPRFITSCSCRRPDNPPLRILFGPACAWTLMLAGALLMFAA